MERGREDILYAIENGILRACVWLPLSLVDKGYKDDNRFVVTEAECCCEGLVVLRPKDCRRIFCEGKANVSRFLCLRNDGVKIRLSDESDHHIITISVENIVIWHEDYAAFEQEHGLSSGNDGKVRLIRPKPQHAVNHSAPAFSHDNHYQSVTLNGAHFNLGVIQARVIQKLHLAGTSGTPWVHGKILLHEAGSNGQRLRDIFKSQKQWRILIASDGKGYYRLNV